MNVAAQKAAFRLVCKLGARTVEARPYVPASKPCGQHARVLRLWREGLTVRDIAYSTHLPRSTVGRWVQGVQRWSRKA